VVVPRRRGRGRVAIPIGKVEGGRRSPPALDASGPRCVTDSRHGRNTTGYDLRLRGLRPSASIASNSSAEDGGLSGGSFDGRRA
jgi:hypothetical protein